MKLFFCWSGDRSKSLAETLASWLGQVIQFIEPWISTGMDKGKMWQQEIGQHLEEAKAGIICLTRENLNSTWVHFESGALAKTKDAHLFTLLMGLRATDLKDPLSWYQATTAEENDIRKLVFSLNELVRQSDGRNVPEKTLENIFIHNWPQLSNDLQKISKISTINEEQHPVRDEADLLQEAVRGIRDIQDLFMQQQKELRNERENIAMSYNYLAALRNTPADALTPSDIVRLHKFINAYSSTSELAAELGVITKLMKQELELKAEKTKKAMKKRLALVNQIEDSLKRLEPLVNDVQGMATLEGRRITLGKGRSEGKTVNRSKQLRKS